MKQLSISILFCLTILSRLLFELGWEVYFFVNQDRIAAEKCENRDRPQLKCNGKCYLAKQLALEQKSNPRPEKAPANPFHLKTDLACLSYVVRTECRPVPKEPGVRINKHIFFNGPETADRYFHPPQHFAL